MKRELSHASATDGTREADLDDVVALRGNGRRDALPHGLLAAARARAIHGPDQFRRRRH